jgi:two-component system, LytTR family, response regulator
MISLNIFGTGSAARLPAQWVHDYMYGFLYWLAFLLVLEPDNVFRAIRAGHPLAFDHEALRIAFAALVGAGATPIVLLLARRFPVLGPDRWRHRLAHAVGIAGLAFGLIVVSCFLAAWGFEKKWLPSLEEIHDQFVSNWLLLVYAIFALSAIAHAVRVLNSARGAQTVTIPAKPLTRIPVKTRGRRSYVDLADIDWIETQGNYLTLHVNSSTHMIRTTLANFETQLDASRFVRIHRRFIVAVDRIRDLTPAGNGDAVVQLMDGRELSASRRYRKIIGQRWQGPAH